MSVNSPLYVSNVTELPAMRFDMTSSRFSNYGAREMMYQLIDQQQIFVVWKNELTYPKQNKFIRLEFKII